MTRTTSLVKKILAFKILCSCLLMLIALILPAYLVQNFSLFENPSYNHIVKAILVGAIVLIGIWFFRSKLDNGIPTKIGLTKPDIAIKHIFFGIGLILVPLIITLILSSTFGWADFSFNVNNTIILTLLLGLISTLFTDALSEELIFRGYIFSNLKEHYNILKSSIITLAVFVIAPIFIISIQNSLNIGGSVPLSGGYIVNMILFGAFMQYLRITFKSIWVGVGFHLIFVHMNQLMGITSDKILQFSEGSNQQPVQITLAILLAINFLSLIIYPIILKKRNKKIDLKVSN